MGSGLQKFGIFFKRSDVLKKNSARGDVSREISRIKNINGRTKCKNNKVWSFCIMRLLCLSLIASFVFVFGSCTAPPKPDVQNEPSPDVKTELPVADPNQSGVAVEDSVISWANMEVDNYDLNLTDDQKAVLQYFDKDYLTVKDYDNLQKYPKAFRNAQVEIPVIIEKIILANDDTFECVASVHDGLEGTNLFDMYDDDSGKMLNEYLALEGKDLLYLTGKQGDARLVAGELFYVYGRYLDVEGYEIDGTSYQIPKVSVNFTQKTDLDDLLGLSTTLATADLYSQSFGETVAHAFFGNDIKLREVQLYADPADHMLVITPDNQSNANFTHICLDLSRPWIIPVATTADLNEDIYDGQTYISPLGGEEQRQINMSSDFKHYILSVYNSDLKKFYLEWYDRDFKKVWSREFDNVDQVPYDYTQQEIQLVADNDLYIIDTATGEDIISPTMVGEKVLVNISTDGTYLIGTGNKDNVMKVDAAGQILWKTSVDTEVNGYDVMMQKVDGNLVVRLDWENIAVIDPSGNTLLSFKDAYPEYDLEDEE